MAHIEAARIITVQTLHQGVRIFGVIIAINVDP